MNRGGEPAKIALGLLKLTVPAAERSNEPSPRCAVVDVIYVSTVRCHRVEVGLQVVAPFRHQITAPRAPQHVTPQTVARVHVTLPGIPLLALPAPLLAGGFVAGADSSSPYARSCRSYCSHCFSSAQSWRSHANWWWRRASLVRLLRCSRSRSETSYVHGPAYQAPEPLVPRVPSCASA